MSLKQLQGSLRRQTANNHGQDFHIQFIKSTTWLSLTLDLKTYRSLFGCSMFRISLFGPSLWDEIEIGSNVLNHRDISTIAGNWKASSDSAC